MKIQEKTKFLYIGDDLDNSFSFFLSKINGNSAIIIVNKNTPNMKIFKVSLKELQNQIQKNKLKKINNEN